MKYIYSIIVFFSVCAASLASTPEITWDYDDIPISNDFVSFLSTPGYSSDGFSISGVHKIAEIEQTFAYRGVISPAYHGQALSTSTSYINTITSEDALPFDILSLDMRGGIITSDGYPDINLFFTAEYLDGSTFRTNFQKNVSYNSLETFADESWLNIISLTIDNDDYYSGYQSMGMEFHEITFRTPSAVPEPMTAAFVFSSLALFVVRRIFPTSS